MKDWTLDGNGKSNSSKLYLETAAEVERIIRESAFVLINNPDGVNNVARHIVSYLAHKKGFRPTIRESDEGELSCPYCRTALDDEESFPQACPGCGHGIYAEDIEGEHDST